MGASKRCIDAEIPGWSDPCTAPIKPDPFGSAPTDRRPWSPWHSIRTRGGSIFRFRCGPDCEGGILTPKEECHGGTGRVPMNSRAVQTLKTPPRSRGHVFLPGKCQWVRDAYQASMQSEHPGFHPRQAQVYRHPSPGIGRVGADQHQGAAVEYVVVRQLCFALRRPGAVRR